MGTKGKAMESHNNPRHYIMAGDRLWNGALASHCVAIAYNRLTDKIAAFEIAGRKPPESLLNGRHNLIAGAR